MEGKKELVKWAKQNRFSFVPVKDKKPLFSWKEFQERKTTNEDVRRWENFDFNGIGVICGGISGNEEYSLEVIDIDNPSLISWFSDIKTKIHKTPSGGYHLIFLSRKENKREVKVNGFDIDLLSKGGFFIFGENYSIDNDSEILKVEDARQLILDRLPKVKYKEVPEPMQKGEQDFSRRIHEFKNRVDFGSVLSYYGIHPKKSGKNYLALCPFHDDQNPSLLVNQDSCYCFSCQKIWDSIALAMEKENLGFFEAVQKVEEISGVKFERPKSEGAPLKEEFFAKQLDYLEIARQYDSINPIIYDQKRVWWVWNLKKKCYEMVDETDILLSLNRVSDSSAMINSKVKGQLLESLKLVGRERAQRVKKSKRTWIQFDNEIADFETGERFAPDPEYFVVNRVPHKIGNSEEFPTIKRLLKEWLEEEWYKAEEILATSLVDSYLLHKLYFLIGAGRNGKDKFTDLLSRINGTENVTGIDIDKLVTSRFESARLYKKKVAICSEANYSVFKNTKNLKMCTGESILSAEYKNLNNFDFKNYAKMFIATNGLPATEDKTDAFYSRYMRLVFNKRFPEGRNPVDDVPEWEYENFCRKALRLIYEAKERSTHIDEPTLEEKRKDYEYRSNPLGKFLQLYTVDEGEEVIPVWEFKEVFDGYCKSIGFRQMTKQEMNHKMRKEYQFESKKRMFGDKSWWAWLGLRWKTEEEKQKKVSDVTTKNEYDSPNKEIYSEKTINSEVLNSLHGGLWASGREPWNFRNMRNIADDHTHLYCLEILINNAKQEGKNKNTIEKIEEGWKEFQEKYKLKDFHEFIEEMRRKKMIFEPKPGIIDLV